MISWHPESETDQRFYDSEDYSCEDRDKLSLLLLYCLPRRIQGIHRQVSYYLNNSLTIHYTDWNGKQLRNIYWFEWVELWDSISTFWSIKHVDENVDCISATIFCFNDKIEFPKQAWYDLSSWVKGFGIIRNWKKWLSYDPNLEPLRPRKNRNDRKI